MAHSDWQNVRHDWYQQKEGLSHPLNTF